MTATIETKVRELVAAIVARVEAEVEVAFERAVDDELTKRRNGDAAPVAEVVDDVAGTESTAGSAFVPCRYTPASYTSNGTGSRNALIRRC
jgi:hypothetical protein